MNVVNGFRALSVLLIIINHFVVKKGLSAADTFPFNLLQDGMSGIYLIFITESYVISMIILKLKENQASISIFKFTLKRLMTTLPVLYLFLFIVKYLSPVGHTISQDSFLSALTLTFNYLGKPHSAVLMHFWAFCAEETMILLSIPLLILLDRKVCIKLFLSLAVFFNSLRVYSLYSQDNIHAFDWWKYMETHLVGFMFCYGILLALIDDQFWIKLFRYKAHWLAFLVVLILGPLGETYGGTPYNWLFKPLLSSLSLALIVKYCILNKGFILSKFLSLKLFQILGGIYYSLYLWQQPFTLVFFTKEDGIAKMALTFLLALVGGIGAYIIVERPVKILAKKI